MEPEWPVVTINADGWSVSIRLRDYEDLAILKLCCDRLTRDVSVIRAALEAEAHQALSAGPPVAAV